MLDRTNDVLVIPSEHSDVCIAFSSRDTPQGKFTFFKMLAPLGTNLIFVNDYSNGWFLRGTPTFQDETFFLNWLRMEIDRLLRPGGKLFMVGASMGAYAALKYGALLGADKILALGPESELCLPLGRSVASLKGVPASSGNIAGLDYRNANDVLIISGSNDIVDVYCASSLKEANPALNVTLIRNRTHVVAKYLNATFDLSQIIISHFLNNDISFLSRAERTIVPSLEQATALRFLNESLAVKKPILNYEECVREVADRDPLWSLPQHFVGLILEDKGDMKEAEVFYRRALHAQGNLGRSRLRLAQLLNKQSRWREAEELLMSIPEGQQTTSVAKTLEAARAGMLH